MPGSSRILLSNESGPREPTPAPAPPPPAPEPLPPAPEPHEPEPPIAAEPEPGAPARQPEVMTPELRERLDKTTREKYEWQRRYEDTQAQLAQFLRQQQDLARQQQGITGPDPKEQALQQFREEDMQRRFNTDCHQMYSKGVAEFGRGMDDAVASMRAVGWGDEKRPEVVAALQLITAMPEGHKVYRALSANLDNAARVLALPFPQMVMELTDLRQSVRGPAAPPAPGALAPQDPNVTRAPEPLRAIGGTATREPLPLNKISMAEFIKRRDKEERRSRILR